MMELSGTLDGVGLPAIVRFLTALNKTGCLHITQSGWDGQVYFQSGRVTHASIGSRRGIAALDALVQALPSADFAFEGNAQPQSTPNVELSPEALQAHLDELAAGVSAGGAPKFPQLDAVPSIVERDDETSAEEPVQLDRGMLQTLLLVDGRRSVREIVSQRGSFDALWQLANLAELKLIAFGPGNVRAPAAEVAPAERAAAPAVVPASAAEPPAAADATVRIARPPAPAQSAPVVADTSTHTVVHCPKLGFEDDPNNSFSRPTRLHRCFAGATPLPLSLDQQRELCLTDQFSTCPRLHPETTPHPVEPEPDDPRIVRLPQVARARAAAAQPTLRIARPMPLRPRIETEHRHPTTTSTPAAVSAPPLSPPAPISPPAPAAPTATAVVEPAPSGTVAAPAGQAEPRAPVAAPERHDATVPPAPVESAPTTPASASAVEVDVERPARRIPVALVAIGGVAVVLIALIGFLVVPQLASNLGDEGLDASALPNTSAVAAGTPVAQVTASRATPAPANNVPTSAPNPAGAAAAAAAAARPATPVQAAPSTARPTVGPQAAPVAPLLDESFASDTGKWPSNPQSTAWIANGTYHVAPNRPTQFVAVGAPLDSTLTDVVVNATFQKLGGPAGGGYGVIVRDQGPGPRDGVNQDGHYYVLEVGDKGEVGIWRRESDHWVDLVPWRPSTAVKSGRAANQLVVRATGNRLSLSVNGEEAASATDTALNSGGVGIFVGGDGNEVGVDHFAVQTP